MKYGVHSLFGILSPLMISASMSYPDACHRLEHIAETLSHHSMQKEAVENFKRDHSGLIVTPVYWRGMTDHERSGTVGVFEDEGCRRITVQLPSYHSHWKPYAALVGMLYVRHEWSGIFDEVGVTVPWNAIAWSDALPSTIPELARNLTAWHVWRAACHDEQVVSHQDMLRSLVAYVKELMAKAARYIVNPGLRYSTHCCEAYERLRITLRAIAQSSFSRDMRTYLAECDRYHAHLVHKHQRALQHLNEYGSKYIPYNTCASDYFSDGQPRINIDSDSL